jgi:hypothetical protein
MTWRRYAPMGFAGALFLISRLLLVTMYSPPVTDLNLYAEYAFEHQLAADEGHSFYAVHEQVSRLRLLDLKHWDDDTGEVEYPPLALTAIFLPSAFIAAAAQPAEFRAYAARYQRAYRACFAVIDLVGFILLAAAIRRLRRGEDARLLIYVVAGALLCPVLYDRLDLLIGVLLAACVWKLTRRGEYVWSFLLLAAAIAIKLVPILLLPIFAVGTLTRDQVRRSLPRHLAARAAALCVLVIISFGPPYAVHGAHSLDFISFHARRGIQIESTWGTLLLFASVFGHHIRVIHEHGAFSLESSWSTAATWIATFALASIWVAMSWALIRRERAIAGSEDSTAQRKDASAAMRRPGDFIAYALAFLMVAMAVGKVFSPQYLLWLIALLPLLPVSGKRCIVLATGFVVVCALTTSIFPYHYDHDIVGARYAAGTPTFDGPTTLGIALLTVRNALFIALTAAVVAAAFPRRVSA